MDLGIQIQQFTDYTLSVVRRIRRLLESSPNDTNSLDAASSQLYCLIRFTSNACESVDHPRNGDLQDLLLQLRSIWEEVEDLIIRDVDDPVLGFGGSQLERGHFNKIQLPVDELAHLSYEGFSIPQIARFFGVSVRTMERRFAEYGLTRQHMNLLDHELDEMSAQVLEQFPQSGYRFVQARLKAAGIVVQRQRIRDSLARLDPFGVAHRFFRFVPRRKYHVAGPNALWHIDGNHKLIRWGFVIHGVIDGYSRMIMSLLCATNNRAVTVLSGFVNATAANGVPSRVRADGGGENELVGRWMEHFMGENRGSLIRGRSVHNQRIERLWRDMNTMVSRWYRSLFSYMEDNGIMDVDNELHILVLHVVFLPRIQMKLNMFRELYNNHKLRTEGSRTPRQVFIAGMMNNSLKGFPLDEILAQSDNPFQFDDAEELERLYNDGVQDNSLVLADICARYPGYVEFIQRNIDIGFDDQNFGITTYMEAVALLSNNPEEL